MIVQLERISGGQVLHLWVQEGVLAPVIRRGRFLTPSQFQVLIGGPVVFQWVVQVAVKLGSLILSALDVRGITWESVGKRPASHVEQWVILDRTSLRQEKKNPGRRTPRT